MSLLPARPVRDKPSDDVQDAETRALRMATPNSLAPAEMYPTGPA